MQFLEALNPEQREAVLHIKGPLLILAGAGSGKTRVITSRIAYLVGDGHAEPHEVLAVTFTNKAAEEMRERARRLLGGGVVLSFIGTFHAWSLRLLRRYAAAAQVPPRFAIADAADQLSLVKEAMEELQISDQVLPPGAVRARISSAKNALVTAKKFAPPSRTSSKKCTTANAFTRPWATCHRRASRRPLRGSFLYEFRPRSSSG